MQVVGKHNTRAWMQGEKTFKSPYEDGIDKEANHHISSFGNINFERICPNANACINGLSTAIKILI